jgi:hypothetical protein
MAKNNSRNRRTWKADVDDSFSGREKPSVWPQGRQRQNWCAGFEEWYD